MVFVKHSSQLRRRGNAVVSDRHTLDARRMLCPIPVIRLQDFVSSLPSGELVEVLCTDPGTRSDIPAWCRISGHQLLAIEEHGEEIVITVKVVRSVERR